MIKLRTTQTIRTNLNCGQREQPLSNSENIHVDGEGFDIDLGLLNDIGQDMLSFADVDSFIMEFETVNEEKIDRGNERGKEKNGEVTPENRRFIVKKKPQEVIEM